MPRSHPRSMESSTWARIDRGSTVFVISRMRSASVDFPWSMWAMIEKLRMFLAGPGTTHQDRGGRPGPPASGQQAADLARLRDAQDPDQGRVYRRPGRERASDRGDLPPERAAERG